jgi:hypothetical protein
LFPLEIKKHHFVAAILKSYSAATMNFTQPKSPSTDVIGATSGGKFITDVSGSCEQVQYFQAFKTKMVIDYIEQCFFRHIGSGANGKPFGRDASSLYFPEMILMS